MSAYGYQITTLVLKSRNIQENTIVASRIGLSSLDDDCMQTALTNWLTAYKAYLSSTGNAFRRKRSVFSSFILTCDKLSILPANTFTSTELATIDTSEFLKCLNLLSASNYNSTDQLNALYGVAKVIHFIGNLKKKRN